MGRDNGNNVYIYVATSSIGVSIIFIGSSDAVFPLYVLKSSKALILKENDAEFLSSTTALSKTVHTIR